MDGEYICHFFWNHLPHVDTEVRMIDGKEEVCLILPVHKNQMKRGKRGNFLSVFRLIPVPANADMITHKVELGYLNPKESEKARQMGYYDQTQRMGRVRIHDKTPEKAINRNNDKSTDVLIDGAICLDNIPNDVFVFNNQSKKRFFKCTFKRVAPDGTAIFCTGAICVDDIPVEDIVVNMQTGKRNVRCRFKRSEYMDTYFNTHELVIVRPDGGEIEIGRFREWRQATQTMKRVSNIQQQENIVSQHQEIPAVNKKNDNIKIDGLNL